ncbi:MAG: glycosyltransferase [Bacteroidia bacterium]|nr:glycosyltransferase [Bacteroidia bacterium]
MHISNNRKVIFLFTKRFPYHDQETYIEDELPYLKEYFKEVIIVPYDEYEFNEDDLKNRKNVDGIKIFKINQKQVFLSFFEKLKREIVVWELLFEEIIHSREKLNHIKNALSLLAQLRYLYTSSLRLKAFISENQFHQGDIIFYNYWLHRGSVICAIFNHYHSHLKIRNISRAHSIDLFHKDWNKMMRIEKKLFLPFEYLKIKYTDRIYSISQIGFNHLNTNFNQFKEKFKIVRLGIKKTNYVNLFNNTNPQKILTCSNIIKIKRIDLIPEIIYHLKTPVIWYHIGDGEKNYIDEIKEKINNYNLNDRCFLLGKMSHSEVMNFYKTHSIDLFMNTSTVEGIPVSIMEAISYGVPVLATDAGGNREIVNDKNGFLIPNQFDVKEVAKIIDSFFSDEKLVQEKRKGSLEIFDKYYNADKNFKVFIEDILSL